MPRGSGRTRERAAVDQIDQLQAQGFTNIIDVPVGNKVYRFATTDTTVNFPGMIGYSAVREWAIQNLGSVRVFEVDPVTHVARRELSRRDISELPLPEEAREAVPRRAEFRLGKEANVRTRQIVRALGTGVFEGITYPGTASTRRDFFGQFTEEERRLLQRAWITATDAEKRLFAQELDAFFGRAGEGTVGMRTLEKILRRMADDYINKAGPYAESRFFTITDLYYYARVIMADEPQEGTRAARERTIGGIGQYMEREGIGRRYERLIDTLKEERRAAIARRLPGLEEVVPAPAEAPAPVEEAAPPAPAPAEAVTYNFEWLLNQFLRVNVLAEGIRREDPAILRSRNGAEIERIYREVLAHIDAVVPADNDEKHFIERFKSEIRRALGL